MASPFPIRTERLLLEPMTVGDAAALAAYRSDPAVARYQSWEAPYPAGRARQLLRGNPQHWPAPGHWLQLAVREAGVLVGDVAVHPLDDPVRPDTVEIGVTFAVAHHGRGLATEAVGALVATCFDLGIHRVTASSDARNVAVAALLARAGLRREGRLVDAEPWKGEWTTIDLWAVVAPERLDR